MPRACVHVFRGLEAGGPSFSACTLLAASPGRGVCVWGGGGGTASLVDAYGCPSQVCLDGEELGLWRCGPEV